MKQWISWPLLAILLAGCAASKTERRAKALDRRALAAAMPLVNKADSCSYVLLLTDSGNVVLKLYNSTPLHRDNFVSKIKEGFYDSLLFHRVIDSFMIQGGDPQSRRASAGARLGNGAAAGDRIPAEFKISEGIYHKRGSLAMARDQNPEKASSNCQFYIVQRKAWSPGALDSNMASRGITLSAAQRQLYTSVGGTPHLDGNYTVFGEVVEGLAVIDAIASSPRDVANRPKADIRMRIQMLYEPPIKR